MLQGNVLITGGSGFLGRGIIRRAKREGWPCRFTVYSRDETKQWNLQHRWPDVRCVLGDVARDLDRLISVMAGHDLVIHAAAVKYIPEAEWNVYETIDVNVIGSRNVAIAAQAAGVETVVGISTDKACAPLNTYGMTKGLMERIFSEANRRGRTRFMTVRYGNVVGSTGSVVEVFEKQIRETGRISVTDRRMSRFWLSVDEAVDLVDFAVANAGSAPGATLVGANPAMLITDLAAAVWQISRRQYADKGEPEGWNIPEEPRIDEIGIRPGEKLAESLFNAQEAPRAMPFYMPSALPPAEWLAGYYLFPPISAPMNAPNVPAEGYSSDNPGRWLTAEDMAAMIRDAREV